jgi:hypothetical protein
VYFYSFLKDGENCEPEMCVYQTQKKSVNWFKFEMGETQTLRYRKYTRTFLPLRKDCKLVKSVLWVTVKNSDNFEILILADQKMRTTFEKLIMNKRTLRTIGPLHYLTTFAKYLSQTETCHLHSSSHPNWVAYADVQDLFVFVFIQRRCRLLRLYSIEWFND